MAVRTSWKWKRLALPAGLAVAGVAAAQPPTTIEEYYGTQRVNVPAPAPAPAPEPPPPPVIETVAAKVIEPAVVPVTANITVRVSTPEPSPLLGLASAFGEAGSAVAGGLSTSAKHLAESLYGPREPRTLAFLTGTRLPDPPIAGPAPAPQIVLMRDPSPAPAAAPAPPTEVRIDHAPAADRWSPELLACLGVSAAGAVIALASSFRGRQPVIVYANHPAAGVPAFAPTLARTEGATLLGGFDVGPLPASAEAFDMGPSYAQEQQAKKDAEAKNRDAVAAFIIEDNLAVQAAAAEA